MNDNEKLILLEGFDYSALRIGYKEVDYGYGPFAWPRCEITSCANCVCIGMSKSLCYPHGIEFGAFTEAQFKENRKRKFNE